MIYNCVGFVNVGASLHWTRRRNVKLERWKIECLNNYVSFPKPLKDDWHQSSFLKLWPSARTLGTSLLFLELAGQIQVSANTLSANKLGTNFRQPAENTCRKLIEGNAACNCTILTKLFLYCGWVLQCIFSFLHSVRTSLLRAFCKNAN